jgi:hypothetical protein
VPETLAAAEDQIRIPRLIEILLNFKNVFRFLQAKKLPTLLTRCVILLLETTGHCEGLFAQFLKRLLQFPVNN